MVRVYIPDSLRWEPFLIEGEHLTFTEIANRRLRVRQCSHRGPCIYKWSGTLAAGPCAGRLALHIGQTEDLVRRIRNYLHGTQRCGNQRWRDEFLKLGDIRLYVAAGLNCDLACEETRRAVEEWALKLESGLDGRWIVNRQNAGRN